VEQKGGGDLHVLNSRRGLGAPHFIGTSADLRTVAYASHTGNHRGGIYRIFPNSGLPYRLPENTQIEILQVPLPPRRNPKVLQLANKILEASVNLTVRFIDLAEKYPAFAETLITVFFTDEYYYKTNNQFSDIRVDQYLS
jgi:hypothetical protein